MAAHDYLEVADAIQKAPDGATLEAGDYDVRGLSGIEAYYKLTGGVLSVIDDGDLSGEADDLIMAEAPLHYSVKVNRFSGLIRVDDKNIIISDNTVVGVETHS